MSEKTNEDSVAVRYMKLVAEVHKDIAELKNGNKEKGIEPYNFNSPDLNGKHGTYLFNSSPAIRKLVVFLATENLEDIEMAMRIHNKPAALLQAALQSQLVRSYIARESGVQIQNLESMKNDMTTKSAQQIKAGFDEKNNAVYYNADDVFNGTNGNPTQAILAISNILDGVVSAVKTVAEKNENINDSLQNKDGMIKDLVELSDKAKKNIQEVLGQCLEKKDPENKTKISFVFKIQAAWNSFLVFIGCRKPKVKQNKIIPEETKDGMGVLSNFIASANKSDDIKNRSVK